jgi:hypothetical protein
MKFKKEATKNNSIKQILQVLNDYEFLTENEIFIEAFGYDRNFHTMSNKKYADMLRRGLAEDKKYIGRIDNRIVKVREDIGRARFVYVLRPEGEKFLKETVAKSK